MNEMAEQRCYRLTPEEAVNRRLKMIKNNLTLYREMESSEFVEKIIRLIEAEAYLIGRDIGNYLNKVSNPEKFCREVLN